MARPPRTVPTKARHDGWTPERQTGFLDALAAHGCVAEACAAVGMSAQSAYRLRARPDAQGFRCAWEAALDLGIRRLTDACLSRALHGEAIPHYYRGEVVGEHRRYDNRLATFLLRYRDPLRYAASLDQMVYSGHPESAAIAFAKARHRAADEAWGVADGPAPVATPPYERRTIAEATAATVEEAEIAGTGPVNGTHERRTRILQRRRDRAEAPPPPCEPPTRTDVEMDRAFPGWLRSVEEQWQGWLAGLTPEERAVRLAEAAARPDVVGVEPPPGHPAMRRADPAATGAGWPAGGKVGGDGASPSSPLAPTRPPPRPLPQPRVTRLWDD